MNVKITHFSVISPDFGTVFTKHLKYYLLFVLLDRVLSSTFIFNQHWKNSSVARTQSVCGDSKKMEPIILVHGGAGDIPDIRVPLKIGGVRESVNIGYDVLKNGGTALDAVEAAVRSMENEEAFNAGKFVIV